MKNDPHTLEIEHLRTSGNLRSDPPSVPVGIFVQEAMDLYKWCSGDKEALAHAGLDWCVVEEIPLRANVLAGLQAEWIEKRDMPSDIRKEWRVALPKVLNLRKELIHNFRHAFHKMPRELTRLNNITKEASNAGIIMSLFTLSILGNKHSALLESIHMDMGMLERAKKDSEALAKLLAKINNSRYTRTEQQKMRNKAFWRLKEAVDEVRRIGQFVLWKDKDKLKGYVSLYKKNKKQRQKKTNPDPKI